jgi:hypothetical protein
MKINICILKMKIHTDDMTLCGNKLVEPLKDKYTTDVAEKISKMIGKVHPTSESESFVYRA